MFVIKFLDGNQGCTTGTPNKKTGFCSKAVRFGYIGKIDKKLKARVESHKDQKVICDKDLRKYLLGLTMQEFREVVETEKEIFRLKNSGHYEEV